MGGLKITGHKKATARLRALEQRAQNPNMARLAETFEDHVNRTFDTEGASVGVRWRSLSKPYVVRKSEMSARGTLELSGGLRASFEGGPWHIQSISQNRIRWGTKHPLARIHNAGSPGRRVPRRQMVRVTRELKRRVREELRAQIIDGG